MGSSLQDCIARLAESDRQERKWLHEEIRELRVALAYLIRNSGGRVEIPKTEFDMFRGTNTNPVFKSTEDKENRCVVLFIDKESQ